jgi:hypothetical protein
VAQRFASERKHIAALEAVLVELEKLDSPHLTSKDCVVLFAELQQMHPEAYGQYQLPALAKGAVAPLLKKEMAGWRPLEQPQQHVSDFARWQVLLHYRERTHFSALPDEPEVSPLPPPPNSFWGMLRTCTSAVVPTGWLYDSCGGVWVGR